MSKGTVLVLVRVGLATGLAAVGYYFSLTGQLPAGVPQALNGHTLAPGDCGSQVITEKVIELVKGRGPSTNIVAAANQSAVDAANQNAGKDEHDRDAEANKKCEATASDQGSAALEAVGLVGIRKRTEEQLFRHSGGGGKSSFRHRFRQEG